MKTIYVIKNPSKEPACRAPYNEYKRSRLPDKYDFTASSEGHDYVYGIDDGKGLADGVGR